MDTGALSLADSTANCSLGVLHLKRYWDKAQLKKTGKLQQDALAEEWNIDNTLLAVLGLGLEQTIKQLFLNSGDFASFENWILSVNNGIPEGQKIDEFNAYILNREASAKKSTRDDSILSAADRDYWNENGYIILRESIPKEDCEAAIGAICDFIDINRYDPETWYSPGPERQGIMVQLFQHPARSVFTQRSFLSHSCSKAARIFGARLFFSRAGCWNNCTMMPGRSGPGLYHVSGS